MDRGNRHLCGAKGCHNSPSRNRELHFFKYPNDFRRPQWLLMTKPHVTNPRHMCEQHFAERCFTSTLRRNLNWNSVPTIVHEEDIDAVGSWHKVNINLDDFVTMGDPSFKLHFRMTRGTFDILVDVVGNHLIETNRLQRERTPVPLILMMVLWILATPDSFRSVALQFGVRPSVVHYHYLYIIEVLKELAPTYIRWPNATERVAIKEAFEEATGFPGVVGCLDGTHHYIVGPRFDKVRYVNRHHSYSLNTQCVCDNNLVIRDIYIGEAGSLHDSRVFRRSPLCNNLLENPGMLDFDEHILGDGGYILTDSVLIPYRNNGHLTELQRNYNYIHAKARVRIENCFGRQKMMWRRLLHLYTMHMEIAVDHILASAVLHNFILLSGEEIPMEDRDDEEDVEEEDGNLEAENLDIEEQYPNVPGEPDHELLSDAKERGFEKRLHVTQLLGRFHA